MDQQDPKLTHLLSCMKQDYDRANKLLLDRKELIGKHYQTGLSIEYVECIKQCYNEQMLKLREQMICEIGEYFYG